MVWLVLGGPLTVVVAALVTAGIAVHGAEEVLTTAAARATRRRAAPCRRCRRATTPATAQALIGVAVPSPWTTTACVLRSMSRAVVGLPDGRRCWRWWCSLWSIPGDLRWFGGETLDLSPRAVYTLAFFVFWAVIAVGAALALLLCSRPDGHAPAEPRGTMDLALILSALMLGVAGAPHCAAMCGPASGSLLQGCRRHAPVASPVAFHLARVASYALAGAVAASSVGVLAQLGQLSPVLRPLWTLLHCAALGLGLWLLWQGRQPAWIENLGRSTRQLAPQQVGGWQRMHGPVRASAAGLLWVAWPCGLLQSALVVAALSNTAWSGAAAMAAFAAASAAWVAWRHGPLRAWPAAAPARCRSVPGRCAWPAPHWPRRRPGRWVRTCSAA